MTTYLDNFRDSDLEELHQAASGNAPQVMTLTASNDAIQIAVRKALATEIEAQRVAEAFLFNDFVVAETWLPREKYKDLAGNYPGGKLYLSCKAINEGPNLSRNTTVVLREFEIMMGYHKAGISSQSVAAIDTLVSFIDQIYAVCRTLNSDATGEAFQFVRNEALVDENGIAFDFVAMQSHSLFEVYWSAVYLATMSP